jgi:hypothetical protein
VLLRRLIAAPVMLLVFANCGGGATLPNASTRSTIREAFVDNTGSRAAANSPAIFVLVVNKRAGGIYEYARTATGNSAPIRTVPAEGAFGVDRLGQIYSFDPKAVGSMECSPCIGWVRNAAGQLLHDFRFPTSPIRSSIDIPFRPVTDRDGNIYFIRPYSFEIDEVSVLTGGTAQVVRIIKLPKEAEPGNRQFAFNPRLCVSSTGEIYYYGVYRKSTPAEYIWSSTASGSDAPLRMLIGNGVQQGVSGVDKSGNAYALPMASAIAKIAYFGPKANGGAQPTLTTLQGPIAYARQFTISKSSQILYEAALTSSGHEALLTSPTPPGSPQRQLNFPPTFDGTETIFTTF